MFTLYDINDTKVSSHSTWLEAYDSARYNSNKNRSSIDDYYIKEITNISHGAQIALDFFKR
jgi:hypothetical protein